MNWSDKSFLLSKNRYSENSLISELFTQEHGKISGIIFGGTSKKIKNYLQLGNKLHVNYNSKNENRIGYFKIEILNAFSPLYFDHKQKLSCIISAMNLIKILTAESQANIKVYKLIANKDTSKDEVICIKNELNNIKNRNIMNNQKNSKTDKFDKYIRILLNKFGKSDFENNDDRLHPSHISSSNYIVDKKFESKVLNNISIKTLINLSEDLYLSLLKKDKDLLNEKNY